MSDINLELRTWDLERLIEEINHNFRFIIAEPHKSFIHNVIEKIKTQFVSVIPCKTKLYRARVNHIHYSDKAECKVPFPPGELGCPPKNLAGSGRINPPGIPYLYCASEADTAAAELRPGKGSFLTIGEVDITRDIRIADLTIDEIEDIDLWDFMLNFSDLFSVQRPSDLNLNYLVPQLFAEHFKANGLRGVKYNSAFNNGGINYALFHECDYQISRTYTVETCEVDYYFHKIPLG